MIVYKVTFPNDKCYIGITSKTLEHRKRGHYERLKTKPNWKFYNALNKYKGLEIWDIIDSTDTWENLCTLERLYIKEYDSCNKGYNSTSGGDGNFNPCKSVRKKMSNRQKGRKFSKEHRENLSKAKLGKKRKSHSEETKIKMSNWHRKNSHMIGKTGSKHHNSKRIVCIQTDEIFCSIREASKKLNIHRNSIGNVLAGYSKYAGENKYTFKYISLGGVSSD